MTTENIIKRLNVLNSLPRNSRKFRDLASFLEYQIKTIREFERKDFLMEKLTEICCH